MESNQQIMAKQIQHLELSAQFKEKSKVMGFATLSDITATAPENLLLKEGFDYNWLEELVTYLSERQLLHLLQETPGSNPG